MAFLQNQLNRNELDQDEINKALGISNQKTMSPDDLEIHTLQEDLELAQNPNLKKNSIPITRHIPEANLSQKQKSSPFFAQNQETRAQQDAGKMTDSRIIERQYSNPEKASGEAMKMGTEVEMPSKSSIWIITGIILIILAFLGGGYYYWATIKNNQEITENISDLSSSMSSQNNSQDTNSGNSSSQTIPSTFSTTSANYMQLDTTADGAEVRAEGRKYIQAVKDGNYSSPIEFTPTDMSNNPVPLDTFLEKMDLVFPPAIRANFGTDFSLFVLNDNGKQRLGLKISSTNEAKLRVELTKEEPSLVKYTRSLLLGWTIPTTNSFASSTYKDAAVRYTNINEANNISIDYTVSGGNFLIGTSKMTLRSMIDYIGK